MKRGTAAKVILGKDTLMDVPAGIVHGTDVILGGKAGLLNDFGGLVLSNNLMIGKKVSRGTITTVTVRGQSPLVLPDAIAGSLQAVKAFGGTEQNGTPTPDAPVDIVSNNGVLVFRDTELPTPYRRILGMTMNDDCYYEITGFKMNGSDTLRFSFTRTGSSACNVIGAYDGTSAQTNYSLYAGATSSANYLRYNGGTYNSYAIAKKKYDVVMTPTGSDGMETGSTWTTKTFTSTGNLCVGTTSPSATSSKMVGSIHGSVVVDDRLELIPCERVSDGEIGYYDTYTETFFEPIGTTPVSLGYDYTHCGIMTSGTVETIQAHGKNWWNPDVDSYEAFYVTAGTQYERYGHIYRNGTYTISRSSNDGSWIIYAKLVNNGTYGTALNVTPDQTRTLTATGDEQILVYASSSSPTGTTNYKVQVELGSTATEYEPYYDGGTATAEMLLKIGDYQDEQEMLTGAVARNVKVIVFDGTENFTTSTAYGKACLIQSAAVTWGANRDIAPICTHFLGLPRSDGSRPDYTCFFNSSGHFYFRLEDNTVATFKAWLADQYAAGTPVILLVAAATPTTESVTGQALQVTAGDNVLEITQASLDNLKLEATYKSLVQLTIQEVEDANLNNNVEVTIS